MELHLPRIPAKDLVSNGQQMRIHKPGPFLSLGFHFTLNPPIGIGVDDWRIPANPAVRLKLPRQSKSHKKVLTHEQVAALADAVEAKPAGEGFGLLILVLAYTGLRWGELSGLRVRDLDFRQGYWI